MSKFENEKSPDSTDLDWLAFCYVAGELEGAALDEFQALLAEDQSAREAVVQAMELASDIYHCGPVDSPEPRLPSATVGRGPAIPLGWMAAAAVVMMAVFVGIQQWQSPTTPEPVTADSSSEALAVAWVDAMNDTELVEIVDEPGFELAFEEDSESDWMRVALVELENSDREAAN